MCRQAGIKVIMVTGDNPHTALAIAREIGLAHSDAPSILTGAKLRHLSPAQLQLALDDPEVICARIAPEQKMRIVEALKRKGHIVAVTGDGVNDAPALKSAHIGIAMGMAGSDVAKEAADMVLLDDNFASIVNAIEEGRAVFDNIRKFLTYILAHNVAEAPPLSPNPLDHDGLLNLFKSDAVGRDVVLQPATLEDLAGPQASKKKSLEVIYDTAAA